MIHIMLPAYNEAAALPALLDSIREVRWADGETYTVLVVDDGSTDATVSACRSRWDSMPLEVSCHITNQGLGKAMMTGLKHCLSRCGPDDIVIAMDADNTHSPALMPAMVRRIRSGSDIVIASRYAPGGREIGLSTKRKILSRGASAMLKVAFGITGARDYTCGYRAYSASILERGFRVFADDLIEQRGFVCMAELLIKLGSLGAKVSETPLVLRYDRKAGASKMNVAGTIGSYLKLITVKRPRVPASLTFAEIGRLGGSRPDDEE